MNQKLVHGSRFEPLEFDKLTPEQKVVAERALGGPRKKLGPVWNVMLRNPAVAGPVEKLGEHVRYHTCFSRGLSELAIMVMVRARTIQYLWHVHYPMAIEAGISAATLGEIAEGKRPTAMTSDETIIYDFIQEITGPKFVSDRAYNAAHARWGEQGIVDLMGIVGYYQVIFAILTVDRFFLPEGVEPPLKPLK